MLAPSRDPLHEHDELEALIREARARQRRRRLIAAALVAAAIAVGFGIWAAYPGGTSGVGPATVSGPSAVGRFASSSSGIRMPVEAVGSSGGVTWVLHDAKLWLTTDDGRAWRLSTASFDPIGSSTNEIHFFSKTQGWIGIDGRVPIPGAVAHWTLARTVDGGRSWEASTPAPSPCPHCFHASLSFVGARQGYALVWDNNRSQLLATADAGAVWRLVTHLRLESPAIFAFSDHRHGVIVKWSSGLGPGNFRLFRTADGGHTWRPVPLGGSSVYRGWFGFPYITATHGTFVIPAEQRQKGRLRPVVYTSSDGGASWQSHPVPPQVFFGYELFSAPAPGTWVAMDGHTRHFFLTSDAGRTWQEVATPGDKLLWRVRQIDFTSAHTGWAILDDFSLVRTTDGGLHWTTAGPRQPKSGAALRCLAEHLQLSVTHATSLPEVAGEYLRVTNSSATPCWLVGWPSVIAVEQGGRTVRAVRAVLGTGVGGWKWVPHTRPPQVTMRPGGSAYAVIEGGRGNGHHTCPTARRLQVNPAANGSLSVSAKLPGTATYLPLCALAHGKHQVEVSWLVPRSALAR